MLKALAVALALGVSGLLLGYGAGETGVREVVRWTARSSLLLLCAAFAAEGLRARLPPWADRSQLLRGLALSHTVHGIAVASLAVLLGGRNLLERSSPVNVLGGALAYAFIYWGALRPDSRAASLGLFWIWGVFMVSYGTRALRAPLPFGLAVGLLVAALLARLISALPGPGRPAASS